jgi:hypothetical protein
MARRRTLDQWRAVVFAATMPDSVRVYLLKLAEHMDARRYVSVPRAQLAAELGRHEQRIAERSRQAIELGYLDTISPGYKGHTAVYQGLFPDEVKDSKGTENRYPIEEPKGTSCRYPKDGAKGTENRYTTSKRLPESSLLRRVPNEGSNEEATSKSAEVHRHAVPGWDREESA